MIRVAARPATRSDLAELVGLYDGLLAEMVALKPIWALTDGLPEPVDAAFADRLDDGGGVCVGEIESVPVGFLVWTEAPLLPQAEGTRLATVELIFTMPDARRVGVGEAMIQFFLAGARARGIGLFDAVVPPGHRDAKNFFESNGFKARRIVMHRDER